MTTTTQRLLRDVRCTNEIMGGARYCLTLIGKVSVDTVGTVEFWCKRCRRAVVLRINNGTAQVAVTIDPTKEGF